MGKAEAHRGRASQGHPGVGSSASPGPNPCLILSFLRVGLASLPGSLPGSKSRAGHWGDVGTELRGLAAG